jgi:hypothetical protein
MKSLLGAALVWAVVFGVSLYLAIEEAGSGLWLATIPMLAVVGWWFGTKIGER